MDRKIFKSEDGNLWIQLPNETYSNVICKKCGFKADSFHSLVNEIEKVIKGNRFYYYVCKNCGEELGQNSHYGGEIRYEEKIIYK
jgi:predicted RNA-binding Zn-ribbon protein involved in translation (DUF1610 family)